MIRQLLAGPTTHTLTRPESRSHQQLQATRTRARQLPTIHQPQSVAALEDPEAIHMIAPTRPEPDQADTPTLPRDQDQVEVAFTLSMFKVVDFVDECTCFAV